MLMRVVLVFAQVPISASFFSAEETDYSILSLRALDYLEDAIALRIRQNWQRRGAIRMETFKHIAMLDLL